MRKTKLPPLQTADVFAPGIALGHGIGRLGCFSAGCCWGVECHLPWAVTFTNPAAQRLVGVPLNVPLHPTQLYEAFAEFLIFAILYWRIRKPHAPGEVIGLYLLLYSTVRFVVEFFRVARTGQPLGRPAATRRSGSRSGCFCWARIFISSNRAARKLAFQHPLPHRRSPKSTQGDTENAEIYRGEKHAMFSAFPQRSPFLRVCTVASYNGYFFQSPRSSPA